MHDIIDIFLHLDKHLENLFTTYQGTTIFIICLILFCETGLVVTPFLPGDSLLFAVGATIAKMESQAAGQSVLSIWTAIPLMFVAVIIGDNVNYFIGNKIGKRLFDMKIPFLKKEYLTRTEEFYDTHGGKTIIMARFVPIIRTFAPFVAGIGAMRYGKYISYCLSGGFLWVFSLTLLGYKFGETEFVKAHFEMVLIGVIFISILPPVIQMLLGKKKGV
jgi:membrane-associated protein